MQSVEALNLLILAGDERSAQLRFDSETVSGDEYKAELTEKAEQLSIASAIANAMLNTALPVAKYRAFIEVDPEQPKRSKFEEKVAVQDEFTVCAVSMSGIIAGLAGIHHAPTNVKVTIWEQRATGADMVTGYQGRTKGSTEWSKFIRGLPALETVTSTVQ